MVRRILATCVATLACASAALGLQEPGGERGFSPEKAFQLGDLDNINILSGNLVVTIPIGPTYRLGGGLSYQLTLVNNGNVWDFEEYEGNLRAIPCRTCNAGAGWTLSMGRLYGPDSPDTPSTLWWVYVSPDGAEHSFVPRLHLGEQDEPAGEDRYQYSGDGSYLRLVDVATGVREVQFPDGTVHRFEGLPTGDWRISKITDAFETNWLEIYYSDEPLMWSLVDSQNRQHTVEFDGGQVSRVTLASDGEDNESAWDLGYTSTNIHRTCKQHSEPFRVTADLLTSVTGPHGMTYSMLKDGVPAYNDVPGNEACWDSVLPLSLPGTLSRLALPTGGSLEWDYTTYGFLSCTDIKPGQEPPPYTAIWAEQSCGVSERRTLDRDGDVIGTWTYSPEEHYHMAAPPGDCPFVDSRIVTTTSPLGDSTLSFFEVRQIQDGNDPDFEGWDTGLPYARAFTPESGSLGGDRFLSTQQYSGGVTVTCDTTAVEDCEYTVTPGAELLRSTWVRYEHDKLFNPDLPDAERAGKNSRLASTRVVYHDDGDNYVDTDSFDFDGLGHYRTTVVGGTYTAGQPTLGNLRRESTNFNPWDGTTRVYHVDDSNAELGASDPYPEFSGDESPAHSYPVNPWPTSWPWILGTYDGKQQAEYNPVDALVSTRRQEFCFESSDDHPTTGFLRRQRVLRGAATQGTNDLITELVRDARGAIVEERSFGGDSDGHAVGVGDLGALTLTNAEYTVTSEHEIAGSPATYGTLQKSYHQGLPSPFYSADVDLSAYTGAVLAARDTAEVQTNLTYDGLGRLIAEDPPGANTTYTYTSYSPSDPDSPRVDVIRATAEGTQPHETYVYDAFGRLVKESRVLADGTTGRRTTSYNALGWKLSQSEWHREDETHGSTTYQYDTFGRPTLITPPDGATHAVTIDYIGSRQTLKTVNVETAGGSAAATTTETADRQGRLVEVTEPLSGSTSATAKYTYDVGGKITKVVQSESGTSTTQTRTFTYDGAGLLVSESIPEATATISYAAYDARGHVLTRSNVQETLHFAYDPAERLTAVTEPVGSIDRPVKSFVFGTSSDGFGDAGNGKLRQAVRSNYYDGDGSSNVLTITETNTYLGLGGRISARETSLEGTPYSESRTFAQSFDWNDLGLLRSQAYPRCTFEPCAAVSPERTVYYDYDAGQLVSVGPYYAEQLSYHANGMLNEQKHWKRVFDVTSGAKDVQSIDEATRMARPSEIEAKDATDAVAWSTGTYGYDGAGNITAMGGTLYRYDLASRLASAALQAPGGARSQTFTYDSFGNLSAISTSVNGGAAQARNVAITSATNRFQTTCLAGLSPCWRGGHDVAGNVTTLTSDLGSGLSFSHYATDELRVSTLLGVETRYGYDADGERAATYRSGDGFRIYLRDLSNKVLREYQDNGTWSWKEDFVWRDGSLLATIGAESGLKHVHLDHLGTPRLITDRCGMALLREDYYPYGEIAWSSAANDERMRFTGHERDLTGASAEDDLDYMHARYYSPMVGRFLSVDPGRDARLELPQSWNALSYVRGGPTRHADPTGKFTGVDDGVFIAGGALVGLAGQGLSDLWSGNYSGWEAYAGAAVGGAVAGEILLYTGPMGSVVSTAAGSGTSDLVRQVLLKAQGKQDSIGWKSVGTNTLLGAACGLVPGPKQLGLNLGRASYNALWKQMTTKLANRTISSVSWTTASKMFAGRAFDTSFSSTISVAALTTGLGAASPTASTPNALGLIPSFVAGPEDFLALRPQPGKS